MRAPSQPLRIVPRQFTLLNPKTIKTHVFREWIIMIESWMHAPHPIMNAFLSIPRVLIHEIVSFMHVWCRIVSEDIIWWHTPAWSCWILHAWYTLSLYRLLYSLLSMAGKTTSVVLSIAVACSPKSVLQFVKFSAWNSQNWAQAVHYKVPNTQKP